MTSPVASRHALAGREIILTYTPRKQGAGDLMINLHPLTDYVETRARDSVGGPETGSGSDAIVGYDHRILEASYMQERLDTMVHQVSRRIVTNRIRGAENDTHNNMPVLRCTADLHCRGVTADDVAAITAMIAELNTQIPDYPTLTKLAEERLVQVRTPLQWGSRVDTPDGVTTSGLRT